MNILVISNLFPPNVIGGYEVGCASMVGALRARGHSVTVLTSLDDKEPSDASPMWLKRALVLGDLYSSAPTGNALQVVEAFNARVLNMANIHVILTELHSTSYDVVYCFNLLGLGAVSICDTLKSMGVPWIWHLMDSVPAQMLDEIEPEICALFECASTRTVTPTRTFVMSSALKNEIQKRGVSLPGAVDIVPGWTKQASSSDIRRERKAGVLYFAVVGVLSEEKGTFLILNGLSLLPKATRNAVRVEFFGRGDIALFESEAERLDVRSIVAFHGAVDHDRVLQELPFFDALLFPTWKREPFGFVALEAGARGVAPIITRGIGASEVLTDGVTSLQIERSANSIANAIKAAVIQPDVLKRIGAAAKIHIEGAYTLDAIAERVESLLSSIAHSFVLDSRQALRQLSINRHKYQIARSFLVSHGSPHGISPELREIKMMYSHFKRIGRDASANVITKWLRSGFLKLLKPYFLELLSRNLSTQIQIELLKSRVSELAEGLSDSSNGVENPCLDNGPTAADIDTIRNNQIEFIAISRWLSDIEDRLVRTNPDPLGPTSFAGQFASSNHRAADGKAPIVTTDPKTRSVIAACDSDLQEISRRIADVRTEQKVAEELQVAITGLRERLTQLHGKRSN